MELPRQDRGVPRKRRQKGLNAPQSDRGKVLFRTHSMIRNKKKPRNHRQVLSTERKKIQTKTSRDKNRVVEAEKKGRCTGKNEGERENLEEYRKNNTFKVNRLT